MQQGGGLFKSHPIPPSSPTPSLFPLGIQSSHSAPTRMKEEEEEHGGKRIGFMREFAHQAGQKNNISHSAFVPWE